MHRFEHFLHFHADLWTLGNLLWTLWTTCFQSAILFPVMLNVRTVNKSDWTLITDVTSFIYYHLLRGFSCCYLQFVLLLYSSERSTKTGMSDSQFQPTAAVYSWHTSNQLPPVYSWHIPNQLLLCVAVILPMSLLCVADTLPTSCCCVAVIQHCHWCVIKHLHCLHQVSSTSVFNKWFHQVSQAVVFSRQWYARIRHVYFSNCVADYRIKYLFQIVGTL